MHGQLIGYVRPIYAKLENLQPEDLLYTVYYMERPYVDNVNLICEALGYFPGFPWLELCKGP